MPILTNEYLNYSPEVPKILYHYCPLQSFLSIIENKNIWLSDAEKTNDRTELKWLLSNINEIISTTLAEYSTMFSNDIIIKSKYFTDSVINNLINGDAPIVKNSKNYLVCFSEAKDLLSQWRAYADDGKGIAIGFNSEFLELFASSTSHGFTKIIYNEEDITRFLIKSIYEPLKWAIQSSINTETNLLNDHELQLNIVLLIFSIFQEGFVFKHKSFLEEQEWRILKRFTSSNFNDSDGVDAYGYAEFLEGIFSKNDKYFGSFSRSELKFRSVGNDIRTYLELGFENIKSKIIKRIVIGPKCEITELDIKLLLAKNRYITGIEDDTIDIIPSEVPYK